MKYNSYIFSDIEFSNLQEKINSFLNDIDTVKIVKMGYSTVYHHHAEDIVHSVFIVSEGPDNDR